MCSRKITRGSAVGIAALSMPSCLKGTMTLAFSQLSRDETSFLMLKQQRESGLMQAVNQT